MINSINEYISCTQLKNFQLMGHSASHMLLKKYKNKCTNLITLFQEAIFTKVPEFYSLFHSD
jgi:hypothetical protein